MIAGNISAEGNASSSSLEDALKVVDTIIYPVIHSLILLTGFIGNSLVIIVVKKKQSMQTTTNILLANLSFADLLTLVWSIPIEILTNHPNLPPGLVGSYLCKILSVGSLVVITLIVSILLMTIIALERYNALVKPFNLQRRLRKRNIVFVIVSIWLIAISCSLPVFIHTDYDSTSLECGLLKWERSQYIAYYGFLLVCLFLFPVSIISFCYFSIIKELNRRQKRNVNQNNAEIIANRKVILILVLVTSTFALCFGLFGAARFLYELIGYYVIIFNETSFLFLYLPCSINPIIYVFQSSNYRNAFREMASKMKISKSILKSRKTAAITHPRDRQETAV